MIRIFTVTAPLQGQDPAAAGALLDAASEKLRRLYPPLIEANVHTDADVVTVTLRVSARDQWSCFSAARKIGTNMLLRLKIPAEAGVLELVGTAPSAKTLTKERGRNMSGHRPRQSAAATGS